VHVHIGAMTVRVTDAGFRELSRVVQQAAHALGVADAAESLPSGLPS